MKRLEYQASDQAPIVLDESVYDDIWYKGAHLKEFAQIDQIFLEPSLNLLRERLLKIGAILDSFFKSPEATALFQRHREYYRNWDGDRGNNERHLKTIEASTLELFKKEALRHGLEPAQIEAVSRLFSFPKIVQ